MKFLFRIASLTGLVLLLSYCKKDHGILGNDVQPAGDALKASYNASANVFAYTMKYDSVSCGNDRYKFLGSNLDPFFGRTDAGLYVNSTMNLTSLNFGTDANIIRGEIILFADVLNSTGDATGATLTYSVYAIDSVLNPTRFYYTNSKRLYSTKTLIGTATTQVSTSQGKPAIRIPISTEYANAILNNPAYLQNNDTYQAAYKGFYITAEGSALTAAAPGAIYKCDTEDDISGFYLYYQNGTPTATKQDKIFRFPFSGTNSTKFNTMRYNPAIGGHPDLIAQVVAKDTTKGSEHLFLKGLGGTKLKVYIPSLNNYADSNVAISRAEVIFNVDQQLITTAAGLYAPPPTLVLLPMDENGREMYSTDNSDISRYDGTYDATLQRYVFNIARHAQLIAEGKVKNYGFYLVVANIALVYSNVYDGPAKELVFVRRDNFAQRVIIAGTGNTTLKPACNISYVKLNNR